MTQFNRWLRVSLTAGFGCILLLAGAARTATAQTGESSAPPPNPTPAPVKEEVVVSATRESVPESEIPGAVAVISGDQLRRENVRTLADALQDVTGLDTGLGSDNGSRLPNIGLWGLKEFDALLVMVDGVPVGGPFNPNLDQIPIDDVDRIEVVRGPQGTLYGVSAFAGMIQVFTRSSNHGTAVELAGGSFSEGRLHFSHGAELGPVRLTLFGTFDRAKGWQDRTDHRDDRGGLRLEAPLAGGTVTTTLQAARVTQFFGSPLPVDAGQPLPGFQIDRNYEAGGARLDHHDWALTGQYQRPLSSTLLLENTLGVTRDDQISIRSFIDGTEGNTATAAGVALKPRETDVYDDLHLVASFDAAGRHRLVGGAALTWGRTTAVGTGFDIELQIDPVVVPQFADTPTGDHRSFVDRRTFLGFYVNDEWTPVSALTITGGARFDTVSETLFAQGQEVGAPAPDIARDSRSDGQWSGGLAALYRLVSDRAGWSNSIHLYAAAKSAFKPAAPNLTEAESARILEPERTRSGEIGVKTRWLDRRLSLDLSLFHMTFENLVVSTVAPDGTPALTNAGSERFQGMEIEAGWRPASIPGMAASVGYAHHDARFIRFSFVTPEGEPVVVDGKRPELVPRDLWNAKLSYAPSRGPGAFVAVRHQSRRPFNRRNTFWTDPFYETDAGVSWEFGTWRASLVGRNLGNSRHFVAESEVGDSQFYVAPPRRFLGEVAVHF